MFVRAPLDEQVCHHKRAPVDKQEAFRQPHEQAEVFATHRHRVGQQTTHTSMSRLAGLAGRSVTLADLEPRSGSAPLGARRPTLAEPAAIPSSLLAYEGREETRGDAYGKYASTIFPSVDGKRNTGRAVATLKKKKSQKAKTLAVATTGRGAGSALAARFGDAMNIADQRDPHGRGESEAIGRLARQDSDPEAARDYLECCAAVSTAFADRSKLSRVLSDDEGVAAQVGVSARLWREAREDLGACVFEQKWADKTCAELAGQVTVGCLEHGRLLEVLRQRFGTVFNRVCRLHSDALWQLDKACGEIQDQNSKQEELQELRQQEKITLQKNLQEALMDAGTTHADQLHALQKQDDQRRRANLKLNETVKTLNGVFKDLQRDKEMVSKSDLKNVMKEQKVELALLREEVEALRSCKGDAARVPVLEKTIRSMHGASQALEAKLADRESVVAMYQAKEAKVLREEELKKAKQDQKEGELAALERDGHLDKEEPDPIDEEDPLANVLCIKCGKSLSDMNNIREAIVGPEPEPPKLVCHGFRLLLPPLGGERPPRSVVWTRRCMRAIIGALLRDHAAHGPYQDGRTRFPEFAYAFFEPPRSYLDKLSQPERREAIKVADDDRWGLYYGVKLLSRESDEAKLFWSLLDESHGVDFLAFYLYCNELIQTTAGVVLVAQGAVGASTYFELKNKVQAFEAKAAKRQETGATPADPPWVRLAAIGDADALSLGGQQAIWLPLVDALEAAETVLQKGNLRLREGALKATKDIAVESEGRSEKWGAAQLQCVDMALWLRVLTHLYREEQAHRRAAVRLMFETALAGTIAVHAPDYGEGRVPETPERNDDPNAPPSCVDLPQFVAIVRTLLPDASTCYAAHLYREAHEASMGKVNYEVFLETCEKQRFFAKALALPHHARAPRDFPLPQKERRQLGAVVHVRERMMRGLMDRVENTLSDHAKSRCKFLRKQFDTSIELAQDNSVGDVDGLQPLAAYRRLLQLCLDHRLRSYELGNDYPEGTGEGGFGQRLSWRQLTPGDFVVTILRELRCLELVLVDFHEPESWTMVARLQTTLAVARVSKSWKRRQQLEHGAPQSVRLRMRKGYMSGRGGIKEREIRRPSTDVLARVGLLYEWLFSLDLDFVDVVHGYHLQRFGLASLAERELHDLFLNCRERAGVLPRLRVFCLLTGAKREDLPAVSFLKPGSLGSTLDLLADAKALQEATIQRRAGDALEFYVNSILQVRRNCGLEPDGALFPETHTSGSDGNACGFWLAPMDLLEQTARELLDARLGAASREMDILVGDMELLRQYDDLGDVDAFLHLLLRHWATAVDDRVAKALRASKSPSSEEDDDESDAPTSLGAAEALRSTKGFEATRASLGVAEPSSAAPTDEGAPLSDEPLEPAPAPTPGVRRWPVSPRQEEAADALAVQRQHFHNARAYGQALLAVEGGGAIKEKLTEEAACAVALERTARRDVSGAWARKLGAPARRQLFFDARGAAVQLLQVWDAYAKVIAEFLDEFEVTFMEGFDLQIEAARGFVYEAGLRLDGLRKPDWAAGTSTAELFKLVNGAWAAARDAFDAVHTLRGVQAAHVATQLAEGRLLPEEVADADLVPVVGWTSTLEFLRDAWVAGSATKSMPVARAVDLDAVAGADG